MIKVYFKFKNAFDDYPEEHESLQELNDEQWPTTLEKMIIQYPGESEIEIYSKEALKLLKQSEKEKNVNAPHYSNFFGTEEWTDTIQKLKPYRNEDISIWLELVIRQYFDRSRFKGTQIEDLKKMRRYLDFYIRYLENDKKFTKFNE